MDILIAFIVGNLAKLSSYVLIRNGLAAVIVVIIISCLIVHFSTKRFWLSGVVASVGFAGYEFIFSSLEPLRGLYSVKYEWTEAFFSFVSYLIFTTIIHYAAMYIFRCVRSGRDSQK